MQAPLLDSLYRRSCSVAREIFVYRDVKLDEPRFIEGAYKLWTFPAAFRVFFIGFQVRSRSFNRSVFRIVFAVCNCSSVDNLDCNRKSEYFTPKRIVFANCVFLLVSLSLSFCVYLFKCFLHFLSLSLFLFLFATRIGDSEFNLENNRF